MSRATPPQHSFADLEFIRQGIQLDPTLKAVAAFLDKHASLVAGVRRGKRSAEREALEKSRAFKRGQRFRAGIEGRIAKSFVESRAFLPATPAYVGACSLFLEHAPRREW